MGGVVISGRATRCPRKTSAVDTRPIIRSEVAAKTPKKSCRVELVQEPLPLAPPPSACVQPKINSGGGEATLRAGIPPQLLLSQSDTHSVKCLRASGGGWTEGVAARSPLFSSGLLPAVDAPDRHPGRPACRRS